VSVGPKLVFSFTLAHYLIIQFDILLRGYDPLIHSNNIISSPSSFPMITNSTPLFVSVAAATSPLPTDVKSTTTQTIITSGTHAFPSTSLSHETETTSAVLPSETSSSHGHSNSNSSSSSSSMQGFTSLSSSSCYQTVTLSSEISSTSHQTIVRNSR